MTYRAVAISRWNLVVGAAWLDQVITSRVCECVEACENNLGMQRCTSDKPIMIPGWKWEKVELTNCRHTHLDNPISIRCSCIRTLLVHCPGGCPTLQPTTINKVREGQHEWFYPTYKDTIQPGMSLIHLLRSSLFERVTTNVSKPHQQYSSQAHLGTTEEDRGDASANAHIIHQPNDILCDWQNHNRIIYLTVRILHSMYYICAPHTLAWVPATRILISYNAEYKGQNKAWHANEPSDFPGWSLYRLVGSCAAALSPCSSRNAGQWQL